MFILHYNPIYVKRLNSWLSSEAVDQENDLLFHFGVDYDFYLAGLAG